MTSNHPKKFLFVSGIQRSGTTALANTINCHNKITVCIERFKKLMNRRRFEQFVPELFGRDRLLDFSDNFTNLTPSHSERFAGFYRQLEGNYENLEYIGDKVPNNFAFIASIHDRFPNAKSVFIVRDILETACSWQARAERVNDGWPENKTAEKAVAPWNNCNSEILSLSERYPNDCYVVDYQSFFDGDPDDLAALVGLTNFLGLQPDNGIIEAYGRARSTYATKIKGKDRSLSEEAHQYIADHADFETYQRVLGLTVSIPEIRRAA